MKKVLAEFPLTHQSFQIAMRSHYYAYIHLDRFVATDALDFTFFQHAQQLGLHGERHVADFVEKNRTATRLLKFSGMTVGSASE